jgi:CHASE2 domain-containing sensor protein
VQLRPAEPIDERILLVKVTADDIKNLGGEYPLHDRTMLRLLKKLGEYKPRVIGLDIYRDRAEGEGREELVKYLQEKSDHVVSICINPSEQTLAVLPPPSIPKLDLGFGDFIPDSGTIVRRHLLSMKPAGSKPRPLESAAPCPAYYALSLQLAYRYLYSKNIPFTFTSQGNFQLGNTVLKPLKPQIGFYQQADTQGYQILLNYRFNKSKDVTEYATLTQVLNNELDSDLVKDKIILIGMLIQLLRTILSHH